MGFTDLWNRTLVYFGIAEEDEWDDDYAATEELERSYQERPNPNVRRLSARRREREFEDWTDSSAGGGGSERTEVLRPTRLRRVDSPPATGPIPRKASMTRSSGRVGNTFNLSMSFSESGEAIRRLGVTQIGALSIP